MIKCIKLLFVPIVNQPVPVHINNCNLYEEVGGETLSDWRMCRRILLVHKTIHNKISSYLKDKLPANYRPYLFSVNISNTFCKIRCRSLRYLNSFFPNAIASWNIQLLNIACHLLMTIKHVFFGRMVPLPISVIVIKAQKIQVIFIFISF